MSQKKKGASSNYIHGGPPIRGNMSGYVGSMSGSLQDNVKADQALSFQKSPMLNTGKKMSNTSLQRGYNRSSAPQGNILSSKGNGIPNPAHRTAANWMAK